ncbi:hypothetical protein SAMN05421676_11542 [Salinibacillus kushneri]|uniref:Uncharacterized protein n=1 Tax=Salinibacillus kushneri TaxID=237682 RepID=A0A1I0J325_9BACI|nr:hypothetical protein [Salinibacillus kushneri]SEU03383.1 hypothetical protein SAMN05421676_11542 [Salinibacillus kushneri]
MHKSQPHHQDLYSLCKSHMNKYVLAETTDGRQFDGIIINVDVENVILAVPIESDNLSMYQDAQMAGQRQWGYYGSNPPYEYGYYGYRPRFRRLVLPLAALTALSVLPWF